MVKKTNKEEFLNEFTKQVFGHSRDGEQCATCGSKKIKPEDFKDDISRKEFKISLMCQVCQDKTFGS